MRVGKGLVGTYKGGLFWTNTLGMVFFKMLSNKTNEFWIETELVAQEKFDEIVGGSKQIGPLVSIEKADLFASKLTAKLQKNEKNENEFPPHYENWRFAIPTTNQWQLATAIKSPEFMQEIQHQWCRNGTSPGSKLFVAFHNDVLIGKKFVIKPIDPSRTTDPLALRLVLIPPP